MSNFRREKRYIVLKVSDIQECLSQSQIEHLNFYQVLLANHRAAKGKKPFGCVVVENDWPEHELVWKMLESRINYQEVMQSVQNHLNAYSEGMIDTSQELHKLRLENAVLQKSIASLLTFGP